MAHYLFKSCKYESHELDFRHGFHALCRHANAEAGDHGFRQWCVNDTLVAKILLQALGSAKYATVGADVLAQQYHVRVVAQCPAQREIYRFYQCNFVRVAVVVLAHGYPPCRCSSQARCCSSAGVMSAY